MATLARREARPVDQRRHPRQPLAAAGRFVLDDELEHRCRIIDISPEGLAMMAPTRGQLGQRVVCYVDSLGRLEGRIVRLFDSGFAFAINAPPLKREKLARQLAWHATHADETVAEPSAAKLRPAVSRVVLRLPDKARVAVQVIDLSSQGASVICPVVLAIGSVVTLGEHRAHVVRVAQTVAGLRFETALAPAPDGTVAL